MDRMNAYERVMGVLNGKRPDYPPVVPMAREWCSQQAGFDLIDELESVERHVYAQTYAVDKFGYDCVWDMFACHSESEAMGSVLKNLPWASAVSGNPRRTKLRNRFIAPEAVRSPSKSKAELDLGGNATTEK